MGVGVKEDADADSDSDVDEKRPGRTGERKEARMRKWEKVEVAGSVPVWIFGELQLPS